MFRKGERVLSCVDGEGRVVLSKRTYKIGDGLETQR